MVWEAVAVPFDRSDRSPEIDDVVECFDSWSFSSVALRMNES